MCFARVHSSWLRFSQNVLLTDRQKINRITMSFCLIKLAFYWNKSRANIKLKATWSPQTWALSAISYHCHHHHFFKSAEWLWIFSRFKFFFSNRYKINLGFARNLKTTFLSIYFWAFPCHFGEGGRAANPKTKHIVTSINAFA